MLFFFFCPLRGGDEVQCPHGLFDVDVNDLTTYMKMKIDFIFLQFHFKSSVQNPKTVLHI